MQAAGRKLLISLLPLALAAGCARVPDAVPQIVKPYRITIQQGNYVTREMVEQLKPGMTREQVRYILGTPLLTDIFHADRWDYVFYRDAPGGKREQRNFSVIFEDGKLARVVGDLLPSEPVQPAAKPAPAPVPVAKPEPKPEPKAESKPEPAQNWTSTTQNWNSASDAPPAPEPKAEAQPEPKAEAKAEAAPEDKPARGFFGRMLEKIGF
jgi:outer membrane protein assembly factor BamE